MSPYISPISPLYLPYISEVGVADAVVQAYISLYLPISPLCLPYISPISPLYLKALEHELRMTREMYREPYP